MALRNGQMEQNIKVIGKMIKQTGKENYHIQMEIYFKDNLFNKKLMDMEFIIILTVQFIKDIGLMTFSKVEENKRGQMDLNIKDNIKMD